MRVVVHHLTPVIPFSIIYGRYARLFIEETPLARNRRRDTRTYRRLLNILSLLLRIPMGRFDPPDYTVHRKAGESRAGACYCAGSQGSVSLSSAMGLQVTARPYTNRVSARAGDASRRGYLPKGEAGDLYLKTCCRTYAAFTFPLSPVCIVKQDEERGTPSVLHGLRILGTLFQSGSFSA